MKKPTLYYPSVTIDGAGASVVPHAGATLLLRTAQAVGLTEALRECLGPWRRPLAIHDPAKVVLDLAGQPGDRWGLSGRHRPVARRPGGVRPGGLGPDSVAVQRHPRR